MNQYLIVAQFLITVPIILFAIYRFGKTQQKTKMKIAHLLLKINMWFSILFGIGASLFITAMGHTEVKDWGFTALLAIGFTLSWFVPSYLAVISFANKKPIAQIYIWGFSIFSIFFAFILFPFSTILGIAIIFGQLTWHQVNKENSEEKQINTNE